MHGFDSLTLKKFLQINYDFLKNASVQKVQQPSRREIILNLRSNSLNKKLYININPKYPHICFIDEKTFSKRALEIPKMPPMFCMQLRKYIEGSRIKEICVPEYERILELHFEVWDETGMLVNLCLSCEIMGKYSNIILYDYRSKNILGSMHNVSAQKSSIREIYGGIPYVYPPKQDKTDILKTSFSSFCSVFELGADELTKRYHYLTKPFVNSVLAQANEPLCVFERFQKITALQDDDFLLNHWGGADLNCAIDEYYSNIIFEDIFSLRQNSYKKVLENEIKKIETITKNFPSDKKALEHKQKGDLIFQYIYLIKEGDKKFACPYTNEEVELDPTLTPSQNAQKYYAQYSKAKGAFEYHKKKYDEAIEKYEYYQGILFSLDNSKAFEELEQIRQELELCGLLKTQTKDKKQEKIKLEKFEFGGYEIFLGKNNKQNDYLISDVAFSNDIWLHAYNCPSSHVLIKINDKADFDPPPSVLEFAANLVKQNSPAKNSGKTSIIYTRRKNLKKPPGGVLGYVIYKNEKEIVI